MLYDTATNKMVPWIAKSVDWQADGKTLVVKLQTGMKWSDDTPMTAEDIKFTFDYGAYSNPYLGYIDSATVIDPETVHVLFKDTSYHAINLQIYTWPVLPRHLWEKINPEEATDTEITLEMSIGSGPYKLESFGEDRVVFLRDDSWWGIKTLGRTFPAKRIVYFKNMANNVAMTAVSEGRELDMANNYIPGLPTAIKKNKKLHTWFKSAPYMVPDNVVYLMPNLTKAPWSDVKFRKAISWSINPQEIADIAYEKVVTVPKNSLGLLSVPAWEPYNNEDIAKQYGYSYDVEKSKAMFDAAGYKDVDGDGFREYPDGTEMKVKISVPMGWSDWQDALRILTDQWIKVGIDAVPEFPDESKWQTDMVKGEFDCLFNNWGSYVSMSPYTLYMWLFSSYTAIGEDEWTGNFGRYDNPALKALVEELNRTPLTDTAKGNAVARQIQQIQLEELPYIPLWINGMWFVANNSVWTNWPGENSTNKNYPSLYIDKLQMGGLLMLSEIKLK